MSRHFSESERSQKVSNTGFYVCSGGLYILKFDKNSTDLLCFIISLKGACSFVWGAKSPKSPHGDETALNRKIPAMLVRPYVQNLPERLVKQVLLATTTGKQLSVRRRPRWHDYISDLVWSRLGVDWGEFSDIAVDNEVFRVHLGLLSLRPSPKAKWVRKWMNMDTENFYL